MPRQASAAAAPFLKWAGGKAQLLDQLDALFPPGLRDGALEHYVEPFLGGGAVFFHVAKHHSVRSAELSDRNAELVLAWRAVQAHPNELVDELDALERTHRAKDEPGRKAHFYEVREAWNHAAPLERVPKRLDGAHIRRAAELLFLNKTCFNGLFRLNRSGRFNVPFGRYANPTICDPERLRACSRSLAVAEVTVRDFDDVPLAAPEESFVYFDPPYRPLSATSSFTTYRGRTFDDAEQTRLAAAFRRFDAAGAKLLLSNSDPKNVDPDDEFFVRLYDGFTIHTVTAGRMINRNASGRGPVRELAIANYPARAPSTNGA